MATEITPSAKSEAHGSQLRKPSEALNIDLFLTDPSEYFGHSLTRMMSLSRDELDQLQIAGMKRRFGQCRGALPMLDKLADSQNIHSVEQLNDIAPLLFDHATYKSYPASLLDNHRYVQLTAWLNKLTTIDISKIDVSACRSVDDWMMTLSRETPLAVIHTSGTSGTMSFLPWSKREFRKTVGLYPLMFFQRFGHDGPVQVPPLNIDCIYPYYRTGGLGHTTINDFITEIIAGSDERFHAAYPERLSADLALLAARLRVAAAKGTLDQLEVSPDLASRRKEFEAQQKNMPQHVADFFATMGEELGGKRVFMLATSNLLYTMAENGLKQGMRKVFDPTTVIVTGGGGKGIVLPDNWQEPVKEFFGVDHINLVYGMSEMIGQFPLCDQGHYHAIPTLIPIILDSETSRPLARNGTVTGRFAFYDLLPETRWGGFVTGDEVTMHWDDSCPCGRTTPYLEKTIRRFSEKTGDISEEKLSCAAAPAAYAEALDFLNEDIV
jgi:hypothetical protein